MGFKQEPFIADFIASCTERRAGFTSKVWETIIKNVRINIISRFYYCASIVTTMYLDIHYSEKAQIGAFSMLN